jgi:hypothetical protein
MLKLCHFVPPWGAAGTPSWLPNGIRILFGRSEIGSDQRISEEPISLVAQLSGLCHDDFAPMFTCLIHPSSIRLHPLQGIAPQMRTHGVSMTFNRTGEKRFIEILSTKAPIPEESPHVSVGDIESCSNELIHGVPDAAQVHATL